MSRRSLGQYFQQRSGRHGMPSPGVRSDGTVGSNTGYGDGGMQQSTQMGDFFSSGLRKAWIPKTSQRPTTLGKCSADDWLHNPDQPRDRVPTSGLGTVGVRSDAVGLKGFGYRDWVSVCSSMVLTLGYLSGEPEFDCVSLPGCRRQHRCGVSGHGFSSRLFNRAGSFNGGHFWR